MSTRTLLMKFHELTKNGDKTAVEKLIEENQDNKRFLSLIKLREEFLLGLMRQIRA